MTCKVVKHGIKKDPAYSCWISMRRRCNNPNDLVYPYYGGRGIKVCEEWDKVTGVGFNNTHSSWRASWCDLNTGKLRTKNFSVNKYGEEEAFRLACEAMEGFRKDLDEYLEDQTS